MITKEHNFKRYCCFYVSDFHLEMILLPYIKNNIDKSKIVIFTQDNLSVSMKLLLERTNLSSYDKDRILSLNWSDTKPKNIYNDKNEKYTIIINGNKDYIYKVNEEIKKTELNNICVIDCYNISKKDLEIKEIYTKYDDILNTKNIKN